MDPPSETHGPERDELVRRLGENAEANAARSNNTPDEPARPTGQGLFGSTLRAHTVGHARTVRDIEHSPKPSDREHDDITPRHAQSAGSPSAQGHGLFQAALDHTVRAQPLAAQLPSTRPPPAPPAGSRAPDAWRDEVRRMVDRAPFKGPGPSIPTSATPSHQPSGLGGAGDPMGPGGPSIPGSSKPSLRLKLDADAIEEAYRAPKSALPKLLVWLLILGLIGTGFAYYAESQGGIAGLIKRFSGSQPTLSTQEPLPTSTSALPAEQTALPQQPAAAAAPQQPAAATAPQQPAAAAPAANAPPTTAAAPSEAPPPAAKPVEPAKTPAAAPPAAQASKPVEQPAAKPAPVAKPAAPKPQRQVRPQQPVVKVRPIESAPSAAEPSAAPPAPEPMDIPYVPMPGDPPAPDEPR